MENTEKIIEILLSTYQSERYLQAQFDSLLNQTFSDKIRILVRDDGSRDQTIKILECYRKKYPEQIVISENSGIHLGFIQSFASLLQSSTADYVMFCDHDDVWLPGKVEAEWNAMRLRESEAPGRPVLVYTDLVVTESDLSIRSESKFTSLKQRHTIHDLPIVIFYNVISGCTMMMNRKLVDFVLPFPNKVLMHDSYVHLVAAACHAECVFVPGKWILWRQNISNESARGSHVFQYRWNLLKNLRKESGILRSLMESCLVLLENHEKELPSDSGKVLLEFGNLPHQKVLKRIKSICRYGYGKLSFLTLFSRMIMLSGFFRDRK